jgi:hypothetical protein
MFGLVASQEDFFSLESANVDPLYKLDQIRRRFSTLLLADRETDTKFTDGYRKVLNKVEFTG